MRSPAPKLLNGLFCPLQTRNLGENMTVTTNPYAAEPGKASPFELGYVAGFQDPDGTDNDLLPLSPELLDIYTEGLEAGRQDAHEPPAAEPSAQWVTRTELKEHSESEDEMREHIATFIIFKSLELVTRKVLLGLVDLVITALSIPGNVTPEMMKAARDLKASPSDPPDDRKIYIAACSRTDHAMLTVGVQEDGTWAGTATPQFETAVQEAVKHVHAESLVARCDFEEQTCDAVWLAKLAQ